MQSGKFTNAEYVRVVGQLLSGVAYLHSRSIAHRDLVLILAFD